MVYYRRTIAAAIGKAWRLSYPTGHAVVATYRDRRTTERCYAVSPTLMRLPPMLLHDGRTLDRLAVAHIEQVQE